jgi:hypothetical protein
VSHYIEYVAVYVVVSFGASLALIHYSLKPKDGPIVLNPAICDMLRIALTAGGAFVAVTAMVRSGRVQLGKDCIVFCFLLFLILLV